MKCHDGVWRWKWRLRGDGMHHWQFQQSPFGVHWRWMEEGSENEQNKEERKRERLRD